jgi:hypothetical protein
MEQTEDIRNLTRVLVNESRFVFIGGGWVMNDDALPSYKEIMLQMRLGLDFLNQTFGVRPTFGWQIDPFGLSKVTATVLYKLGYDGIVGNRMSQNFKDKLSSEYGFNFYWKGHQVSPNLDEPLILEHIMQKHYGLGMPDMWSENQMIHHQVSNIDKKYA